MKIIALSISYRLPCPLRFCFGWQPCWLFFSDLALTHVLWQGGRFTCRCCVIADVAMCKDCVHPDGKATTVQWIQPAAATQRPRVVQPVKPAASEHSASELLATGGGAVSTQRRVLVPGVSTGCQQRHGECCHGGGLIHPSRLQSVHPRPGTYHPTSPCSGKTAWPARLGGR